MNILVLHGIVDMNRTAKAVVDLEFSLPQFAEGNFLFHYYQHPFPDRFKSLNYDGIILWSSFLDARHLTTTYEYVKREYQFIVESDAIKIALPQDDYYCNALLDEWMVEWGVDFMYSVLYEFAEELFPKFSKSEGKIKRGFTGYIFPDLLERSQHVKPFADRKIDVSYRARGIPTNLNKLANYKAEIGNHFKRQFDKFDLKLDISTDSRDLIFGEEWYTFVEESKFVLGVNSGSSISIPDLEVSNAISDFIGEKPSASYEEIVNLFLSDKVETYYTAISPRNIEAAFLSSCQITTNLGPYSGILEPGIHYIEIAPDCSNVDEVISQMKDENLVMEMIQRSREAMLSTDRLRIENLVAELMDLIKENYSGNQISRIEFQKEIIAHQIFINSVKLKGQWNQWRTHSKFLYNFKKFSGYYAVKEKILQKEQKK